MAPFAVYSIADEAGLTVRFRIVFAPGREPANFAVDQVGITDLSGGADKSEGAVLEAIAGAWLLPVTVRTAGEVGVFLATFAGIMQVVPVTLDAPRTTYTLLNLVPATAVPLHSGFLTIAPRNGWETTGNALAVDAGTPVFLRVYPALDHGLLAEGSLRVIDDNGDLVDVSVIGDVGTGRERGSVWRFTMPESDASISAAFEPQIGSDENINAIVLVSTTSGIPQGTSWWPVYATIGEEVSVEIRLPEDTTALLNALRVTVAGTETDIETGVETETVTVTALAGEFSAGFVTFTMPEGIVEIDMDFILSGYAGTIPAPI
jgi:hypothetical protein